MKKLLIIITVIVVALVGITGCSTETAEPTTSTTLDTIKYGTNLSGGSANLLPMYVAIEKGYFEENGINLELTDLRSSSLIAKAMAAGELDGGGAMAFEVLANAHIEGFHMKMVLSLSYKPKGSETKAFVVLKDSPYYTLDDLRGKIIGGNTRNICPWFHIMTALDEAGLQEEEGDYQYVELSSSQMVQALEAGTVDAAAYVSEPYLSMMGDKIRVLFWWTNYNAPCGCGHCFTEEMINENPDVVSRFVKAFQEGISFIYASEENEIEARKILAKYLHLDEEITMECKLCDWDEECRLFPDIAERQLNWMAEYDFFNDVEKIPALDDLYDYSFAGKVDGLDK